MMLNSRAMEHVILRSFPWLCLRIFLTRFCAKLQPHLGISKEGGVGRLLSQRKIMAKYVPKSILHILALLNLRRNILRASLILGSV